MIPTKNKQLLLKQGAPLLLSCLHEVMKGIAVAHHAFPITMIAFY